MWGQQEIEALLDSRTPEGTSLEFKSELPERNDRGRAEFLKDIAAMANGSGGSILFGITENNGNASNLIGLRIEDVDAEVRRLAQMLDSGIEPRLSGTRFNYVALENGDVLALNVPESFDSPHRYLFNGHSRFVMRTGSHVSELSFDQLRAAFDKSSKRLDKLRKRWSDELTLSRLWKPIIDGPVCVVRLSPMVAADERQVIDPKAAYENWNHLIFSDWGGGSSAFNYEGLAVFHGRGQDSLAGYVQVHRSGAITAYRTARITIDDRKIIPSTTVGDFILEATKKLVQFALSSGIGGSAILHIGLVRLAGYEFGARDRYGFDEAVISDVDEIRMPEIWLEDLAAVPDNPDHLLRTGYDLLWQSFGWAECPKFDDAGRWSSQ